MVALGEQLAARKEELMQTLAPGDLPPPVTRTMKGADNYGAPVGSL